MPSCWVVRRRPVVAAPPDHRQPRPHTGPTRKGITMSSATTAPVDVRTAARPTAGATDVPENTYAPEPHQAPRPTTIAALTDRADAAVDGLARVLTRYSVTALRGALGLVFLGFGVL